VNITVIGTGYVGLVTGACFAELGNTVTCVDIDKKKIKNLKKGILPIYEPGLESLVLENYKAGRLQFVTSIADQAIKPEVYFIAVGTPSGEDGSADLQYVLSVARDIGGYIDDYVIIVDKSTVPVGTAEKVQEAVQKELHARSLSVEFDVVSNPEFLKEGSAVGDFMKPDRVVIGSSTKRSRETMHELYAPFMRSRDRLFYMSVRDAEMTKYVANAMLATKISFMNEMAGLCERMGVDVENVRQGIGSDSRIGYSFIFPGCGYGGSCFPKDVKALVNMAGSHDYDSLILHAVEERNYLQKQTLHQKLVKKYGEDLSELKIAVWGLSFKPGTDDMREATSKVFLKNVIERGAKVSAFDPVAMSVAKDELPAEWISKKRLTFKDDQYDVLEGADVLVLITEWKPFQRPDWDLIKSKMRGLLIVDGRNQYDPHELRERGFEYQGIGR